MLVSCKLDIMPDLCTIFYAIWHLGINMYVLWSFSRSLDHTLGKEQFLALYLSAGKLYIIPDLCPICHKAFRYQHVCLMEFLKKSRKGANPGFVS